MSDIHIYLEREQPVKVITLEPTGARGPVGPQGPQGPAGPNSVTSATTSDGTAELSLESVSIGSGTTTATLDVTQLQIINDINQVVATSSGVVVASYLESGTSQASLTADSIQIGATGGGSVNIYATGSADFSGEVTAANLTVTPSGSLILTSTNSGGFVSINGEAATDARTVAFPDASGTVALFDGSGNLTVSGTLFANHIHGNLAGSVYAHVRAGEALLKGDPVYVSGSHGTAPNLIPIVSKADASNSAKMPAIGIMDADLANNASGHMVITGTIADLNTAAYAVNDTLYVASGGGLTATPPAANSQPVARVERSNANNGALIVKVNGLASSGGNGASDANKLVRFSSTGTIPVASIGGLGTGVATFLAAPTSANLAAAVTDETGSGSLVFATSPTITTPTLSRGSTGLVFTAQDNNNASCNLTTDASGRCFFTVNGKTNGTGNSGAYVQLNGFEEAWTTLNVTSNTSGQRVMRFGTLSNRFSIQRLNDAISSITATPFSFANNAPTNSFYMDSSGNIGLGTSSPTAFVDINSNTLRVRTARTPASATATGNAGDICWDANYIYVCTATNTWKRTAISTW